jgi:superfamily II DNA or RNA helicase
MLGKINPDDYEIFCVTHQTLTSYARTNDNNKTTKKKVKEKNWCDIAAFFKVINVGIKVIDEVHLFFENSFMIDCFSDTLKTFYITATFSRSNPNEGRVYHITYANTVRYGEETYNYEEKRKHINVILLYVKSIPKYNLPPNVQSTYGFSSYKYIDYELTRDTNDTMKKVISMVINMTRKLEGKTLILSPKIASVKIIAKYIEELTGEKCGTICSSNTATENQDVALNCKYISSTAKSSGTGVDIPKLRVLIDLEPVSSKLYMDQIRGRLREYSPDKDTYLFIPVDNTLPQVTSMINRLIPSMRKKSKIIIKKDLLNL